MTNVEILCVNLIVLWEVEVFFGSSHSFCNIVLVDLPNEVNRTSYVGLPRKRYSWIFFRSAFGISLHECQLRGFW